MHLDEQDQRLEMALESFQDDLRNTLREGRGQDAMEGSIAIQRQRQLFAQLGLENQRGDYDTDLGLALAHGVGKATKAVGGGVWAALKATISASAHLSAKLFESARVYFDKTGGREVDRLRKTLANTRGEGGGVITDEKLAHRLQLSGEIPKDFTEATTRLVGLARLLEKIVPEVSKSTKAVWDKLDDHDLDFNTEAKIVANQLAAVKALLTLPDVESMIPSALAREVYLGDEHYFIEYIPDRTHVTQYKDSDSQKLLERDQKRKIKLSVGVNFMAGKPNPRLPVLTRHQVEQMIQHCEHLTDALHRLLVLTKTYGAANWSYGIGGEPHAILEMAVDEGVRVSKETRARANLIQHYVQGGDLYNAPALLKKALQIVTNAHKAYAEYVYASLKQFK